MKKITKSLLIALGFGLLAVAVGFLTSSPAPAQAPPPTVPVTVKNTTAQPVPTSAVGTTAVSGSVTAMQSAPWLVRAAQIAPWSVNVSNSLNGSNRVPLIVQDVDSPGRYPFTANSHCASTTTVSCQPTITLPSSTASGAPVQTVVIEFATGVCGGLGTGINPFWFTLGIQGAGTSDAGLTPFLLPGVPTSNSLGGVSFFSQQITLYALPGSSAQLLVGQNTDCGMSLSGHLIP